MIINANGSYSGSPPIHCFVLFYCRNLLAQFDKLYPWTLKKFESWRPNGKKLRQIENSETRRQKKNQDSETQKSLKIETSRPIKNASEVSRSCQNFQTPEFFKVPFYTRISIQNNLLVLETLPPVVLGHFLSFLKEKRWNKYNQRHKTDVQWALLSHPAVPFLSRNNSPQRNGCSHLNNIPYQIFWDSVEQCGAKRDKFPPNVTSKRMRRPGY